ncbi:MAG: hypothetical protein R3E60_06595 [Alphaproteobacteria bacterium]
MPAAMAKMLIYWVWTGAKRFRSYWLRSILDTALPAPVPVFPRFTDEEAI